MNAKHESWDELKVSLYVVGRKKVRKSRNVQASHEQPAIDVEAERRTQNYHGSDSQHGSDADQTQETCPSDEDRGNEGDSESEIKEAETGESCIEGYYVPRDPVEKPKVNEKV